MKFEKCAFPVTRTHRVKDTKTGLREREYSLDTEQGYSFEVEVPFEVQHRFWNAAEMQKFFVYSANNGMWNVTCPITGALIADAKTRKDAIEKFDGIKDRYFNLLAKDDFEKTFKKQIELIRHYYE